MIKLAIDKAQGKLADTIKRAAAGHKRLLLHRQGKVVAAVVPPEDLAALEQLEDRLDVEDARRAEEEAARNGEKPVPWEEVKKRLGL